MSEPVLPLAQRREHGNRVGALLADARAPGPAPRHAGTGSWPSPRRSSTAPVSAPSALRGLGLGGARLQGGVVGIDREREARVGRACIRDRNRPCVSSGNAASRCSDGHICRRSPFEDAPAAEREQRVAGKQRPVGREPVGDVVGAMAGRVQDLRLKPADLHRVALARQGVDGRHLLRRPSAGATTRQPDAPLQPPTPHVVAMAMGDEDVGERPALLVQRGEDRPFLGRVDGGAGARRRSCRSTPILSSRQRKTWISAGMDEPRS